MRAFLDGLGIPLKVIPAHIHPQGYRKAFSCYICSRNRKRILFDEAGRQGARKVALGHHLDDVVETTLLNLFFRGEFSTMMPVQEFFGGKLSIIRPLCEVEERDVERLARHYPLPVIAASCPRKDVNQRFAAERDPPQAAAGEPAGQGEHLPGGLEREHGLPAGRRTGTAAYRAHAGLLACRPPDNRLH